MPDRGTAGPIAWPAAVRARTEGWGLGRLVLIVGTAGFGWLLAFGADARLLTDSAGYLTIAGTLLVIGLYGSTFGISVDELRGGVRTVVLAVTVGVLAKAVLVAGVMYLAFQEPRYAVLGLAVAQIDPLAVAAMGRGSRMSDRARALIAAWASFDDPITVLLTIYGAAWLLARQPSGSGSLALAGAGSFAVGVGQNLALAACGLALWRIVQWVGRRTAAGTAATAGRVARALELILLAALLSVAVAYSLALGVALLGLFYRPRLGRGLSTLTQGAFVAACFLLGLALADGVHPWAGLLLGTCAFLAQTAVALVIPARISRTDRAYLAVGQQNGITAIILALLLEPGFPGTVGIVAPAILVVAVLHAITNGLLDFLLRPGAAGDGPEPAPPAAVPPAPDRPTPPEPRAAPSPTTTPDRAG